MYNFSMFLCLMVTIAAVGATIVNKICPNDTIVHHTCPNGNGIDFANNCPPGTKIKELNADQIKAILHALNVKRNYIASGNDPRFDSACDMNELRWRSQLADDAAALIKQYKTASSPCNNTAAFRNRKLNVASWTFNYIGNETIDQISAVQSWFDEAQNVNQAYIDSYPENYRGPPIKSFMRMMFARNQNVGCAGSVVYIDHRIHQRLYLFACKYGSSFVPGSPVIAKCNTAGQNCTQRATNYNNLCSS